MAKAVAKPKKIAAKSKSSAAVRAKPAPAETARKALKKSPVKPAKKVQNTALRRATLLPGLQFARNREQLGRA